MSTNDPLPHETGQCIMSVTNLCGQFENHIIYSSQVQDDSALIKPWLFDEPRIFFFSFCPNRQITRQAVRKTTTRREKPRRFLSHLNNLYVHVNSWDYRRFLCIARTYQKSKCKTFAGSSLPPTVLWKSLSNKNTFLPPLSEDFATGYLRE